jgi:hypothetical protein
MAIDTAEKRFSMMDFRAISTITLPVPTGGFDQADRQHILDFYSGVLFGGAVGAATVVLFRPTFRPRRR